MIDDEHINRGRGCSCGACACPRPPNTPPTETQTHEIRPNTPMVIFFGCSTYGPDLEVALQLGLAAAEPRLLGLLLAAARLVPSGCLGEDGRGGGG